MTEMMKSDDVRAEVDSLAERVAVQLRPTMTKYAGAEVEVQSYTTDRAAAAVVNKHPAALAVEAKYGAINRAAGAVGLEVREKQR